MGRISLSEVDNYRGSGSSGTYFSLKDNGDKARVRILCRTVEDLDIRAVHEVQVGDNTKKVNCLRNYNEPVDKCPFCAAGLKAVAKVYLQLYNEDAGEVQVWERGTTMIPRIGNLASHFNPLCDEIIEVVRNGVKGDKQTTYDFMPLEKVPTDLDSYEIVDPSGWMVLEKTAEEMNTYLDMGDFPSDTAEVVNQRADVTRRTPSNSTPSRRVF